MRRLALLLAIPILIAAAPVRVTGAKFQLEIVTTSGQITRVETTRIPYEVGDTCYRWTITVDPKSETRRFTERFTLPDSAKVWGEFEGSTTKVKADRKVAETVVETDLSQGVITNGWCVAEGDPAGRYKIEVFDGKRLIRRFDFDVVLPPGAMS